MTKYKIKIDLVKILFTVNFNVFTQFFLSPGKIIEKMKIQSIIYMQILICRFGWIKCIVLKNVFRKKL